MKTYIFIFYLDATSKTYSVQAQQIEQASTMAFQRLQEGGTPISDVISVKAVEEGYPLP